MIIDFIYSSLLTNKILGKRPFVHVHMSILNKMRSKYLVMLDFMFIFASHIYHPVRRYSGGNM